MESIVQVFFNILSNAWTAMRRSHGRCNDDQNDSATAATLSSVLDRVRPQGSASLFDPFYIDDKPVARARGWPQHLLRFVQETRGKILDQPAGRRCGFRVKVPAVLAAFTAKECTNESFKPPPLSPPDIILFPGQFSRIVQRSTRLG